MAGNTTILLALLAQAENPELLEQMAAYIETHLGEQIILKNTARRFWVSESKICQIFHQKVGISFYRCVTRF